MNGLELQDILLTFPEGGRRRTVLDIPYLKVTSGEHIGIRGASGSGKSSLLNVVSGLVLPDRGTVRWGATVPGALPEHERDRWRGQHIGFVFQDFQLFPELEALENVLLPATFTGWRIPEALIRRGRGLLEQMHVCPTRKVRALSRGEKQRVAIAGVIAMEPKVLILDEPTAGLDPAGAASILANIETYRQANHATVILVSHSMEDVARLADRLVGVSQGTLPYVGTPREVFSHGEALESMGLAVPAMNRVFSRVRAMGVDIDPAVYTVEQAKAAILDALRKKGGR